MNAARWLAPLALILAGCDAHVESGPSEDKRTPLEKASQAGDLAEVRRLLASGADPNDRGGMYGAPLNSAAIRMGNSEIVRALLAAGANPEGRGQEGTRCWVSPLSLAASAGDADNVRALLDAGAKIQRTHCSKPIAGWLKPEIIDLLRPRGLDIFAVDENGRNELHNAFAPPAVPAPEGIAYLLRAGVSKTARDKSGKTPVDYWRQPRHYESHWVQTWMIERLSDDPEFKRERENRSKIWKLLEL